MVYLFWVFGEMRILYWVYGIFSIGLIYVNVGFVGKICKFFESKNAIITLISFIFIFFYAYLHIGWCQNSSNGLFFIALDWFNVVEWWILFLKLRVNFNFYFIFLFFQFEDLGVYVIGIDVLEFLDFADCLDKLGMQSLKK